jgi:transposase
MSSTTADLKRACRFVTTATMTRDAIIVDLWRDGSSYRAIAEATDGQLSHGTIANIINRRTEGIHK